MASLYFVAGSANVDHSDAFNRVSDILLLSPNVSSIKSIVQLSYVHNLSLHQELS